MNYWNKNCRLAGKLITLAKMESERWVKKSDSNIYMKKIFVPNQINVDVYVSSESTRLLTAKCNE